MKIRNRVRAVSRKAVLKVFIARRLPHLNHSTYIVSCCSTGRRAEEDAGNQRFAWPIQAGFLLEWGCYGPAIALCHSEQSDVLRQIAGMSNEGPGVSPQQNPKAPYVGCIQACSTTGLPAVSRR